MILRPATNDLTLVYYSANALPENVANNFRRELLNVTKGIFPIIIFGSAMSDNLTITYINKCTSVSKKLKPNMLLP